LAFILPVSPTLPAVGSTEHASSIDMWSVGCILYEMLDHRPLFPGSSANEQFELIFRKLGTPSPERHPQLCSLPGFQRRARQFRHYTPRLFNESQMMTKVMDLLLKLLKASFD